jgi:hypothetical protein
MPSVWRGHVTCKMSSSASVEFPLAQSGAQSIRQRVAGINPIWGMMRMPCLNRPLL